MLRAKAITLSGVHCTSQHYMKQWKISLHIGDGSERNISNKREKIGNSGPQIIYVFNSSSLTNLTKVSTSSSNCFWSNSSQNKISAKLGSQLFFTSEMLSSWISCLVHWLSDRIIWRFTTRPLVNFTNILQTAFAQIFFQQKITKPNCKWKKVSKNNFVWKSCS